MSVPLLDLSAQHDPLHGELMEALERVLTSGRFILGPEVEKLEADVAVLTGSAGAVGVSSGTDALLIALMSIDLQPGDEVITTPYSFFATAGAIARLGARPVFVDIDRVSFNIDSGAVAQKVTAKTRAVIPVHLFGRCADMIPIVELGRRKKLAIIEDAAQAIGALTADHRPAGGVGDLGCFSFFPSKNLGALGDGGMVVCRDGAIAEKVRILRNHGMNPKYFHRWIGGNFRLDALQAAVLNVKWPHLQRWTRLRQENARRYELLFGQTTLLGRGLVCLPAGPTAENSPDTHIYNQFVIRSPRRDAIWEALRKADISAEVYYPVPLHLQECFAYLGYRRGDFPESERAAQEALALPIYPGLTETQQALIVDTIAQALR